MWSKGAVVVVKRGDIAMADAIEKGMQIQTTETKKVTELESKYGLIKIRDGKYWDNKIADVRKKYKNIGKKSNPMRQVFERGITYVYLIFHREFA